MIPDQYYIQNNIKTQRKLYNYEVDADYSYIKLHCIDDTDDIFDLITEAEDEKGKWIIFVDSKSRGNKLLNSLIEAGIPDNEIVFIDARYEQADDANQSVVEAVQNQIISRRIVICTSVFDNGISLHDNNLRNIVILADVQDQFIQMLGRKRADNSTISLYM